MNAKIKVGLGIKKKLLATAIVIVLIFIFAPKVYANGYTEAINIYYYDFDENGQEYLKSETCELPKNVTDDEKAVIIFRKLVNNENDNLFTMLPEDTEIIFCYIQDNILIVNFTKELIDYDGGSANEKALLNQIVKNVENMPNIEYLTLLVEGMVETLPEGSIVYKSDIKTLMEY